MAKPSWNSLNAMIYGGDYNPEQWPESVWEEDVVLMQQAGVNLVSLGIFSWARINPAPGEYDTAWLERIMDLLHAGGIRVNLATATASPPAWLGELHPEIRAIDRDGSAFCHGGRQNYTPNSEVFTDYALRLCRAIADRFKDHPALAMWHVNNEYHGNGPVSWGEEDARAFRQWLRARYGDLDGLNHAWGTTFWSQVYTSWEEVVPPRKMTPGPNPTMALDYQRFFSDAFIELYRKEAAALREVTPDLPVTTNLMQLFPRIDHFKIIRDCDFAAFDCYPDPLHSPAESLGISADLTRSLTPDQPWLLMEQVTSQVNWRPPNTLKRPGITRLWSLAHIARGSDGAMFFQWRQARFGSEMFHAAMVPSIGPEDSRIFSEVCQLGADLKKLQPVVGSTVEAKIGILWNWENLWAIEQRNKPNVFNHNHQIEELYKGLWDLDLTANFLHPDSSGAEYARYDCIIVPSLYLMTEGQADRIRTYTANGGHLLVTHFSGLVDANNHLYQGKIPVHLRDVLGLWVEEWDAMPENYRNALCFEDGTQVDCEFLFEIIHCEAAKPVATYKKEFYAGLPALTAHPYGKGTAQYLATRPAGREAWKTILKRTLPVESLRTSIDTPSGVEALVRSHTDGRRFLFLLNHRPRTQDIDLNTWSGIDLLTEKACSGRVSLPAHGTIVLAVN